MRWFRSHIRLGSRLALFALAVQLFLSFGHVHLTDLGLASANAAPAAMASGSDGAPTHRSDGPADPGCAICALIQLAATSAPSAAPVLPLLITPGHVRLEASDQFVLAASPQLHFRARAPPIA